ncbi:hypothetical protein SeLEV6574_g02410 [Synchytrium endobioticum]|nr:hypothetical protein SeLEV6574_g02410 [Synchytrium endobioticum]
MTEAVSVSSASKVPRHPSCKSSQRSARLWKFSSIPPASSTENNLEPDRFCALSLTIPKPIVDNSSGAGAPASIDDSIVKRRSWIFSFASSSASSSINDDKSTTSKSSSPEPPVSIEDDVSWTDQAEPALQWPNNNKKRHVRSRSTPSVAEQDAGSPISPTTGPFTSMSKPIILKSNNGTAFTLPISAVLDSTELRPLYLDGRDTGSVDLDPAVLDLVVGYLQHHATLAVRDAWDAEWAQRRSDDELRALVDAFVCIGNTSGQTLLQKEILRRTVSRPVALPRGVDAWKRAWAAYEHGERTAEGACCSEE